MNKNFYRIFAVLTAVIIALSLVKGAGLALIRSLFPEGQATELTEIMGQDWTESETGESAYYTIPDDLSDAQVLEVTSNWNSMDVYLEEEPLYSFSDEYHELGRAAHWIQIPAGSNGKRIILRSDTNPESLNGVLQSGCYLGTADAIRHHFFMKNLPTLLLVVVDMMMAGIVILILAVLRRKLSASIIHGIWDLFFFILLNGVWLISDSGFLECFTARTGLWALVSYIAFMMMPVFMVSFVRQILTYRKNLLRILIVTGFGLTSATLILYLTRVAPLSTLLVFHQVLMVVDIVVVYLLCNHEIKNHRIKRLVPIRTGIVMMGSCAILSLLLYWCGLNTLYPLFYSFGFTCYIACLTISVVQQVYYNLGKKAEMDTYRKLAYKDVMTMVYNRSAFTEYQKGAGENVRESAYVLFDINGLKRVNDTLGHQAGDDLIIRAAACIRETFEEVGNCYRIGGDEFMAVLGNIRDRKEVMNLLEHFEKQVRMSNRKLRENQSPLSIAYGFSLAGELPRSGAEMYKEADGKMYEKKREMKATSESDAINKYKA